MNAGDAGRSGTKRKRPLASLCLSAVNQLEGKERRQQKHRTNWKGAKKKDVGGPTSSKGGEKGDQGEGGCEQLHVLAVLATRSVPPCLGLVPVLVQLGPGIDSAGGHV